jgi:hypothetical protein
MKHGMMSRLAATLTRSYLQVLSLNRKAWLPPLPSTITATLPTTPLGQHTTGLASMMAMEILNAHRRSQGPTLYLNRWTRTVEERVGKTSLNLKWICYWLSKSKKSCHRLPLLAPHVLTVTLLSDRTLGLTRNMIKAELVTAD